MKSLSLALCFIVLAATTHAADSHWRYATLTLITDVSGNSRVYLDEAAPVRVADVVPPNASGTQASADGRKTIAQLLNTMGADGWELVAVVSAQPSTTQYVFKQPASPPSPAAGRPRSPFVPAK